jgi:probable H4MPT-linked C1 transfer pathway protein
MYYLGIDIGGANTKAALIETHQGCLKGVGAVKRYFPLWKKRRELPQLLREVGRELIGSKETPPIGVTMTAELCDCYKTKGEGVSHVLESCRESFPGAIIKVLDVYGGLIGLEEAIEEPLRVAASNWVATGWMVSHLYRDCIVVDVGSTTTSIIPIINGRIVAEGRNDLEKLMNGELVYTGSLRTNIAALVDRVPVKGGWARVSSELFALSGDIHLLLDHIGEEDYTTETADGRGVSKGEARARLARVVCADAEMLGEEEILELARYIYRRQVDLIVEAIEEVWGRVRGDRSKDIPLVAAGLGAEFLASVAGERAGFRRIIDLSGVLGGDVSLMAPSVGVALMLASMMEGGRIGLGGGYKARGQHHQRV